MKPNDFDYVRADSVAHALELLEGKADVAKILAGGQSLIATLNMRLSAPELLIDINPLDELRGIEVQGDRLRIGALTRHVELQRSPLVAEHVPLIAQAIEHVAHAAVRNRGTIGGNIAFADPASELPACALALDAEITIASRAGQRQVSADAYFKALYETALGPEELLVAITFPLATSTSVTAFREFVRRRGDFATTGIAVNANYQDAAFERFSAVFFGLSDKPISAANAAKELTGKTIDEAVIERAQNMLADELNIMGDSHASAEFKLHLAKHFLAETVRELDGGKRQ